MGLQETWNSITADVGASISTIPSSLSGVADATGNNALDTVLAQASQTYQATVGDVLNKPTDPFATVTQIMKNTVKSPTVKVSLGIGGILAIAGLAYFLFFKGKA